MTISHTGHTVVVVIDLAVNCYTKCVRWSFIYCPVCVVSCYRTAACVILAREEPCSLPYQGNRCYRTDDIRYVISQTVVLQIVSEK